MRPMMNPKRDGLESNSGHDVLMMLDVGDNVPINCYNLHVLYGSNNVK